MIRAPGLLVVACGAAQADSWPYRVELDPAAPLVARVVVELPAERRAQDFSVQVRGLAQQLMPQIAEPRCDGAPLAPDSAGAWRVQGWNCARLSWSVSFRSAVDADVDPRLLESVFDPRTRFWLFSEMTSLLRPVGEAPHDGEIVFVGAATMPGGEPGGRTQWRLVPDREAAPGLYVVGELPHLTLREGGTETTHVIAHGIDLRHFVERQRQALRYLASIMRLRLTPAWRGTVVWLARRDAGEPHSVAGLRTLLLASAARDGQLVQPELALLLVLREQFVQMAPAAVPLWVRESLAQYYAIKALRRSDLPAEAINAAERRFIDPLRAPVVRLREAQRRIEAGETALRDELNRTGATFWDRLDRAIVRKSGFRTLDSALPRILAAEWSGDRLPQPILERLYRYAGESAVDELLSRYVGR